MFLQIQMRAIELCSSIAEFSLDRIDRNLVELSEHLV